jgi:3-hydroxyacyl-CoA dehydrogenase / 3-hydroxy-2-methylbutyryl-CoA dehydrogenase
MKLQDVRAVITGGASGLGEGAARMIVEGGGRVALFDLETSRGADLAAELGARATFVPMDVTDTIEVDAAISSAAKAMGGINVVMNSAGVSPAARVVTKEGDPFPLEKFQFALDVNLLGAFDVLRRAAAVMLRNEATEDGERGLIVNIGSTAAFEGQVGQAAYSASKGAIVGMTLPLARDLSQWGIRVMTICPGTIDTPMVQAAPQAVRQSLSDINVFPKRLGLAADIAGVVKACIEVSYLNGEVIRVDAGSRMPPR